MLLATAGYDYALSGYRWSNPSHITYSVAPDGVSWDHGTNNLNASLNAKLGDGIWQREFALALATWESVANLNIAQVADGGQSFGYPGKAQSDPHFGDIRLGGYTFPASGSSTLAQTYFPPPQGMTEAGDLEVNTTLNFTNGAAGYDFFSVMLHETGHALGLDHSPNPDSVMYFRYQGVRSGLQPGDIAGIQAIYGPRSLDAYQGQGLGRDWGSAIDVTSSLGAAQQATVGNVALATIGDTEFFTVVAPSNPGASLQITAAASNMSLLSPKLTLFNASGTPLAVAANPSAWSNTVSVNTTQVVPGQRYYVAVTGATSDAFAVGAYQLQVAFAGGGTPPNSPSHSPQGLAPQQVSPGLSSPPPPVVSTIGPDRFEPNTTFAQATNLGLVSSTVTAGNLTLDSAGDVDNFVFRNGRAGIYRVVAGGAMIRIFDGFGRQLAVGAQDVSIRVFRPRTPLYVQISAPAGTTSASYALTVAALNARGKVPNMARANPPHRQGSHWPVRARARLH